MSKAYGLSGLRLGWFVGPQDLVDTAWQWKDYTTISISPVSDFLARLALANKKAVLARNTAIARTNWEVLLSWLNQWSDQIDYVPPAAGVLIFPWLKRADISGTDFCRAPLTKKECFWCPVKPSVSPAISASVLAVIPRPSPPVSSNSAVLRRPEIIRTGS